MLKLLIAVALAYFSFVLIQQYLVKNGKPVEAVKTEIEEINQKIGAVKLVNPEKKMRIEKGKQKQQQQEIPIEYLVRPLVLNIEDYYSDADEDFFRAVYFQSSIK